MNADQSLAPLYYKRWRGHAPSARQPIGGEEASGLVFVFPEGTLLVSFLRPGGDVTAGKKRSQGSADKPF